MTSEKAQIQALLNGIDEVLNKTSPRLPWVMSGDAVQQRQILEQTRQYLIQLQLQLDENPLLLSNPGFNAPAALPQSAAQPAAGQASSESAQQVLQAVLQEMNYWRVNMLQPLRSEIDSLQRQREMLTQELRQLEVQRQQHSLPQQNQKLMMEFLQSAMLQMQANLSAQVSQMVAAAQPQLSQLGDAQTAVSAADRMAQIQAAQTQTDQLMLKLDATVQRIFESLSRNLQTYEASLEQGLHRMHDLGQQGEAMYAFLVNRMAQQLGREASSMLQAAGQPMADQPSLPPPVPAASPESAPSEFAPSEFTVADFLSQVPNQQPDQQPPDSAASVAPFNLTEDVLDIAALDEAEMAAEATPTADNLEALHQELDRLDLAPLAPEATAASADTGLDLFAGDQPFATPFVGQPEAVVPPVASDDFDSALDLLNQLSAEMQLDGAIPVPADTTPIAPVTPQPAASTEFIASPDALYGDAFGDAFNDVAPQTTPLPASAPAVDAATLAQEWFGGLGDPAEQQPTSNSSAQPPARPQFSDGSVSQSLESFLLNDAPPASGADLVIDPREAVAPVESPDTIASLFDLLPESTPSEALQPGSGTAAPSPELPIQEAAPEDYTVDLGDSLQAFQQDFQVTESAPNPVLDGGWEVFSDLPAAASHPANSIPAVPAAQNLPEPSATPVDSLDSLFADIPDLNAATTSEVPSPAQVLSDLFAQLRPGTTDSDPSDSEKKN